jgi:hypothetical protein
MSALHVLVRVWTGAGVLAVALWAFVRQPVLPVPPRRPVRISLGLMPPPPPLVRVPSTASSVYHQAARGKVGKEH